MLDAHAAIDFLCTAFLAVFVLYRTRPRPAVATNTPVAKALARFMYVGRPTPIVSDEQFGFTILVFNGNDRPVKLSAVRELRYGKDYRIPRNMLLVDPGPEIAPGSVGALRVLVYLRGDFGAKIKRHIADLDPHSFGLQEMDWTVSDGETTASLPMPSDVCVCLATQTWRCTSVHRFDKDQVAEIVMDVDLRSEGGRV